MSKQKREQLTQKKMFDAIFNLFESFPKGVITVPKNEVALLTTLTVAKASLAPMQRRILESLPADGSETTITSITKTINRSPQATRYQLVRIMKKFPALVLAEKREEKWFYKRGLLEQNETQ